MNKLNVGLISNNFFKVYFFDHGKILTGAPFFSVPINKNLVEGNKIVNIEETQSLLLPQIARAHDQIKFHDLIFLMDPEHVIAFAAHYDSTTTPEEVFNQIDPKPDFSFEEAEILVKGSQDGLAQAYVTRKDYLRFIIDIFKSDTFNLKGIVPLVEVAANITADVDGPHILVSKMADTVYSILVNHNMVYETIATEAPEELVAKKATELEDKKESIEVKEQETEEDPTKEPEKESGSKGGEAKKSLIEDEVAKAVKKLQDRADKYGFVAKEIYLTDSFTIAFQDSLTSTETKPHGGQTADNVVKIVQVPFEEGVDSTAFAMIMPSDTYSQKGVNFWYLGEASNKSSGNKKFMGKVIIGVLLALLIGGAGVWFFLQRQSGNLTSGDNNAAVTPSETPITVTVAASPSATPTPSIVLERKNLKVQVLNGGGKTGEAARVKGILEGKGYVVTSTGNGDSTTDTKLQLKPTKKEYFNLILKDLEGTYIVTAGDDLAESSANDAVLLIGTK